MSCVAPLGNVYQAGTLSGNPVAVAAGIETLKILMEDTGIYERIDRRAQRLEEAFRGEGLTVNRAGSLLSAFFLPDCGEQRKTVENYEDACGCDREAFAGYFNRMLARGIYVAPSQFEAMFVSDAHSEELIERTCAAISESVVTIHGALHLAARHPANKVPVSSIQPLAEGDLEWAGCVTVRGRSGREL